ncbi:MAG: hypothetical protein M3R69_15400, partial [Acidobacteriota bacterium]|nr:hypothetical protein [Acidobacteriota bacterium]
AGETPAVPVKEALRRTSLNSTGRNPPQVDPTHGTFLALSERDHRIARPATFGRSVKKHGINDSYRKAT